MRIVLTDEYTDRLREVARRRESGAATVRRLIDAAWKGRTLAMDGKAIDAGRAEYIATTGRTPEES